MMKLKDLVKTAVMISPIVFGLNVIGNNVVDGLNSVKTMKEYRQSSGELIRREYNGNALVAIAEKDKERNTIHGKLIRSIYCVDRNKDERVEKIRIIYPSQISLTNVDRKYQIGEDEFDKLNKEYCT